MRWQAFSTLKFYLSAGVALVGISAASTLLTSRVSQAQVAEVPASARASEANAQAALAEARAAQADAQAAKAEAVEQDAAGDAVRALTAELEAAKAILSETLGKDHPKMRELQSRLDGIQQRSRERLESENAQLKRSFGEVSRARSTAPMRGRAGGGPAVAGTAAGTIVTENISGGARRVVVQNSDGTLSEVVSEEVLEPGLTIADTRAVSAFPNIAGLQFRIAGQPQQVKELQGWIAKLKTSDASNEDKTAAKEKIASILAEQFDEDMTQRSQQIEQLEKKVATLKEQIEKRRAAKDRLIELRIEMLKNESEGLGFPNAWQQPMHSVQGMAFPDSLEFQAAREVFPSATAKSLRSRLAAPVPPVPPVAKPPVAPEARVAPAAPAETLPQSN